MKTTTYYLSLIGTLVATLGFAAFTGAPTNDVDNSSRIIFSHELHAMMAGCEDCHDGVAESESLADLALPGKPACENCHDVEDDDNCGMCHPDDTFEALVDDEDELIFNHKAHAEFDAECLDCHKGIDEVDYGSEAPTPPMAQCYQCHNDGRASNDMGLVASNACEMCHVSTANLVPDDHLAANFDNEHGHESELADADCQMCHEDAFCESCHAATIEITELNTADDFYRPYESDTYVDGPKMQRIERVHDLNYAYTHAIDARSKTTDCQSCHQLETFCAECHSGAPNNYLAEGAMPTSHMGASFTTVGVGTGGGTHAELARRDMESCVACHDLNGGDPTCVTCHFDNDGVQGTNPKTHADGFLADIKGDWHDSQGSMCYNCHMVGSPDSPNTFGFCGYCHN